MSSEPAAAQIGERGCRVRVFQKRKDGPFYTEAWHRGVPTHAPVGTHDPEAARKRAHQLYADLLLKEDEAAIEGARVTLRVLGERYRSECADFKDNKERGQADSAKRAELLIAYFGEDFCVDQLSADRQREYEQKRIAGGICTRAGFISRPVRPRSPQADVNLLHTMLRWGMTIRAAGGQYLLERNPLAGVKKIREKNPRRPVATYERYVATTGWLRKAAEEASTARERNRWQKIEFALFLAESTGRRLNSIRNLAWEDFNFAENSVVWRADADKKGIMWKVQMPAGFMMSVQEFRTRLGAPGMPPFTAEKADSGLMDRHLFDRWLAAAENGAELAKLEGGLWHAYRRKWAIERKHLPLKDVAAAGGWSDVSTLLEIYQQADATSVLAVTSEPKKLRAAGVS